MSLTDRARAIPSSVDQQSKEMKHVIAALRANGYPKRFVIHASKPERVAIRPECRDHMFHFL